MTIYKATYTITVLGEFDSERDAERSMTVIEMDTLGHLISEGDWIGQFSCDAIDKVEADKVKDELVAIGNDGTFFDNEMED